jgi:hypothetical protein
MGDRAYATFYAAVFSHAGQSNCPVNKFSSVRQRTLYLAKLFGIINFVRVLPELCTAECPLYDEYGDEVSFTLIRIVRH